MQVGATQVGCFVDMAATMTEYHSSSLHDEMPHNNCGDIKRTQRSWATEPVRCSLPSSQGVAAAGISTSDGVDTSPVVTYLRRCPMSSTELVHLMWGDRLPSRACPSIVSGCWWAGWSTCIGNCKALRELARADKPWLCSTGSKTGSPARQSFDSAARRTLSLYHDGTNMPVRDTCRPLAQNGDEFQVLAT